MAKTETERLYEAKDVLRVDGDENDSVILALVRALPGYIETVTGMSEADQENEPIVDTVRGFILTLWYYADHTDDIKLQRTIDNLLKVITLKANTINREGAAE